MFLQEILRSRFGMASAPAYNLSSAKHDGGSSSVFCVSIPITLTMKMISSLQPKCKRSIDEQFKVCHMIQTSRFMLVNVDSDLCRASYQRICHQVSGLCPDPSISLWATLSHSKMIWIPLNFFYPIPITPLEYARYSSKV